MLQTVFDALLPLLLLLVAKRFVSDKLSAIIASHASRCAIDAGWLKRGMRALLQCHVVH